VINPQTKTKLEQLKLQSFIDVFNEIINNNSQSLSLDEALTMMVDREIITRDNRRLTRLLKAAKLRYPSACIAHIDYQQPRQFEQERLRQLTHCQWIAQQRNCILTGPAGIGKSYIACALGHQACQLSFSVRYYRVPRLVEILRMSHADGSYSRTLERLAKIQCLILDDWGIDQLDRQGRRDLLEVLEDRYAKTATIITTQLPIDRWHQFIGDDTIADAICDRIINNAFTITMSGESMRKVKNLTHVEHPGIS
jgi:DNA replication protein DnaC